MKKYIRLYEIFINWLRDKMSPRQFLIFSSILVGMTAGFAAVILKTAVHYIHLVITYDYHIKYQYVLYLVFPTIGILLTVWFVQKHLKGKLGRGTANILHSIAKKSSFLPQDQMYSHIVTSALTVGFGGSAGLESPIVVTGSAIGSNYSKIYHINYKDRTLLLACGAAAGIAAAFNSPIAGVLFALEVLLVDVSISAFIPLIIAAATGGLLSKIILNENILLSFHLKQPFNYYNVPYYIVLGLLAGIVSVYYARTYLKIEDFLKPKKKNIYRKAIIGGLILGILILFFPSLFGEGYGSIKILSDINPEKLFEHSIVGNLISNKWVLVLLILLAMLFKTIAAAFTIGSGGNGGNFAPSLFVGAYLGFAFATVINLLGISDLPVSNFTIVAMAGILSGVFHAPLTGIFLIAEITGGYELMIPLMIVSAISFMIVKYFEPYSMDTKKLAKKGHIFTADKDKNILSTLKTVKVVETDFQIVSPDATLGQLVKVVARSKRNIFPVVADEVLVGIILLDNIREIMFKHEMYESVLVKQLMRKPPATVSLDEDMLSVMKKFDETNAWNLPVVNEGKYVGFISKSSIFTKYRETLVRSSIG
ncbi:MAG: chloride channel protein [Bacteroidota bacterium]